ncbi:uncharacterized protein G2W53_033236 [Senna tora]|uniref:Uncharacterized protein n=1 Tax=Senna tora TaxID=362788 RepID=A0A834SXV7_9FABA|nr:uncharacterized protein G2W53_033236 [Senna tora]
MVPSLIRSACITVRRRIGDALSLPSNSTTFLALHTIVEQRKGVITEETSPSLPHTLPSPSLPLPSSDRESQSNVLLRPPSTVLVYFSVLLLSGLLSVIFAAVCEYSCLE